MKRGGTTRRAKPKGAAARPSRRVQDNAETRERLISAARALFVEHGFEHVTVRDICREARANIAAVNYHFGDKLGLYREVAREVIEAIRGFTNETMETTAGTSAENRLRHYVKTFLPKVTNPNGDGQWIGKLMNHEMAAPTPLAPWIFSEGIMPRILYLKGLIAELLDCDPDDERAAHCAMSVQAQCLFYRPDPFKDAVVPGWPPSDDAAVAAIADHIVGFSLAGVKSLRKKRT